MTTNVLGDQADIQYQGVADKSEADTRLMGLNMLLAGHFKRGRTDKPFKVTKNDIRSKLGFDPTNLEYCAVEDALNAGAPFVYVQRLNEGDEAQDSSCTSLVNLKHNTVVKVPEGKYLAIFYRIFGRDTNLETMQETYEFEDGDYVVVQKELNSFIQSRSSGMSSRLSIRDADETNYYCAAYGAEYPIRLRKGSGSWTTLSAGSVVIKHKGSTYNVPYDAASFSTTGALYNYMISLFANIKAKLEEIGLMGELQDDKTFENSTTTSFTDAYWPKLLITAEDGDLSTFTITMNRTDSWMLDGYPQQYCAKAYDSKDLPATTETTIDVMHPSNTDDLIEDFTKIEILKNTPAEFAGNYVSLLSFIDDIKEDIIINSCYMQEDRQEAMY